MFRAAAICWAMLAVGGSADEVHAVEWTQLHGLERVESGFKTTAPSAWLLSQPLETPVTPERCCLLMEVRASEAVHMRCYWRGSDQDLHEERAVSFHVSPSESPVSVAANLHHQGTFTGLNQFRLDAHLAIGGEFAIRRLEFVRPDQIPQHLAPGLIDFRCFTSKLHYQPSERIEYRAVLSAACYPDRQSAKILEVVVADANGKRVASGMQQYGILNGSRFKEIQGVLDVPALLGPGKYVLEATSTDQRSGLILTARHAFGVQGPADPFVCETPFKFVKDFSFIQGPDDRWHVFSITGDLFANHDWALDGQERTFSHASSANLCDWTIHAPVVSISDKPYPDGRGRFKDRNVWAPHVIKHDGRFWMFYTAVNQHVSQSVSLATSRDLYTWDEYEQNPVFTLEGVEWATWRRDAWADCRDPCVIKDGDKFYIYATARAKPPGKTGAVVVAESEDLIHWHNPAIAVRRNIISESAQVWKTGDTYCMTTSSHGVGTYASSHPVTGWQPVDFPRPNTQAVERYVPTSASFAEEVVRMSDGTCVMASLTFRHHGNSIYFFRMKMKNDLPVAYESPWRVVAPVQSNVSGPPRGQSDGTTSPSQHTPRSSQSAWAAPSE